MNDTTDTRMLATVPVRLGYSVIELSVESASGATPHLETADGRARFIVPDSYDCAQLEAKIEEHMPEIMKTIARRFLN